MSNELKENQIRVKGEVTFLGERTNKNDYTSDVLQIMQTEDVEETEWIDITLWGKSKDRAYELAKVGDIITATIYVSGSRKLWNELAFPRLSLSFIEVHTSGKDVPADAPAEVDDVDESESLPF